MIRFLVAAAVASVAPAPTLPGVSTHELIAGAEHAVQVKRLDQAALMVERAIGAGATGPELDRVLGDLAYASGKYPEALARYDMLLKIAPSDELMLEKAGIAALKLGESDKAYSLLSRATSTRRASWRAWNALGAVADLRSDWALADKSYAKAARLAPAEAGPVNNRGWSLLLRGEWKDALGFFERAKTLDPSSDRAANNAELAKDASDAELPKRQPGEPAAAWAARLNDAGVAAAILGDRSRATAAFNRALDVNDTWYVRAANNLDALGTR